MAITAFIIFGNVVMIVQPCDTTPLCAVSAYPCTTCPRCTPRLGPSAAQSRCVARRNRSLTAVQSGPSGGVSIQISSA